MGWWVGGLVGVTIGFIDKPNEIRGEGVRYLWLITDSYVAVLPISLGTSYSLSYVFEIFLYF